MTRTRRVLAAACAVLALALAGCSGDGGNDGSDGDNTTRTPRPDGPVLQGWVFDAAVRPLAGVSVAVLEQADAVVQTNADGHYVFDVLPTGQPLIVAASLAAYEPQTKGVTLHVDLPTRLNFTLARVPAAQPFHQVIPFAGFLSCQAAVVVGEDTEIVQECGSGDESTFRFTADPGLAGVVVEVAWTEAQPLAASLHAALFIGEDAEPTTELVGGSILRLQVAEQTARDRLANGGDMSVQVRVLPNTDENEAGVGAGVALNQDFQVFASLFYVAPPDATYSVAQ
jgi:hypothetical protein